MNNTVGHFELPADDLTKAQDFYGKVFGWKFKNWDKNYISVRAAKSDENGMSMEPGAINGGIQKRGPRAKGPTVVISVGDIDAALASVEKAGGSIAVPKEEMAGMGYYAQFEDLDGNRLGLFQSLK